jgi:hypothetical protein
VIRRLLALVAALTLVAGLATLTAISLRPSPKTARANCAVIVQMSPHYLCWGPNGLAWV